MSQTQTTFPRWIPLLGGLLGSTTCGLLLYAFSVFIKPLQSQFPDWTTLDVTMAYAIICLVFGLVTFPAGRLSDKYGPRYVVLIGGIICAIGFALVSTITNKWQLYLYYGVVAGLGGGMIYLPPIATAPKWWPDKRAMATGFTVVGLGLGSFIMPPIAQKLIAANNGNPLPVFWIVGIAMGVLVVLTSLCLKVPPPGYKPAGWNPPAPAGGATAKATRDYTYEETKKSPQFWLLFVAYFCGSFAGLMVITVVANHGLVSMTQKYLSDTKIDFAQVAKDPQYSIPELIKDQSLVKDPSFKKIIDNPKSKDKDKIESAYKIRNPEYKAATDKIAANAKWAVMILAIFNALVRVSVGPIIDKIGSKALFVGLFTLQVVAMTLLFNAGKEIIFLAAVAGLIGWNYGAMFTLFPATLLQYYGPTAQGSNYGLLFTAWGLAGFAAPLVVGKLKDLTGSYQMPFLISAGVVAVAVIILATLKAPEKKQA